MLKEQNNYQEYLYSPADRSFFRFTVLSIALGVVYPVVNNGSTITGFISLFSTFSALFAIISYLKNKSQKLSPSLLFFGAVLIYMLVVGFFKGSFSAGKSSLMTMITQDLRYVFLFFLGGIYAEEERYMEYYDKIVRATAVCATAAGFYCAFLIAQSGSIIARFSEDDLPYHLWWISAICFAYCGFFAFVSDKPRKYQRPFLLAYIIYFILGMSFLKRSCFLNSIFILLFSNLLLQKKRNGRKSVSNIIKISLVLFTIILVIPGVNKIVFGSLFDRFSETASDIDNFDRLIEWKVFQENSSTTDRLLGFGIGKYLSYDRYGNGSESTLLNALHLGFANIIYKGGILYALFYIVTYFRIFKNWFKRKQFSSRYIICFGVSISALISLLYEGSWTYTVLPFFISTSIFYAASNRANQ